MENFRTKLAIEAPMEVDHAVIIQGTMRDKADLMVYLRDLDLADDVIEIQYVYDVEQAYKLLQDMRRAGRMELRYKDLAAEGRTKETVSHDGCLCCLVIEEPALQYWTQEKLELNQRFIEELGRVTRVPKVFIVWSERVDVQRMLNTHKLTEVCRSPHRTSLSWNIAKAPVHYDINWENYAESNPKWWFRAILINIVVLILLFFFTTPIIVFLFLYETFFEDDVDIIEVGNTFWTEFGTILILLAIEQILPQLVNLSCSLERHRTKTNRNYWCIWKVFIYLVLSELFMPAFGYTSLAALLRGYFSTDDLLSNWSCVFSAYRIAFMCKILLSAALIGRAFELFNPWGVASYIYYYLEHKTSREYREIFVRMRDRFNIGYNYAKLMAYSAIFISFGVICPLITLIGLAFVFIKYSVDKYLMIYFHRPCSSYGISCHVAATTYVVFSCCLLQIFMLVYDAIYIGFSSPKTLFALIMVVFIITIYYYDCWTRFVRWLFPERPYSDFLEREVKASELAGIYLPPFLQQSSQNSTKLKSMAVPVQRRPEKESFVTADSPGVNDYGSV
ncbi:CSC1-like protein 1 [Bolinopsis microptera]|uniref:CSC1-like protein 1 n=1 Tax=Bolinopsis microptera TaxID=2820187 RepID=UPI00307A1360